MSEPTEPPDPDPDPDAEFAAIMEGAREQAAPDGGEAPFGYTRDRSTGETRPKKSPGRGGVRPAPTVEEMKAAADAAAAAGEHGAALEDRAPAKPSRKHRAAARAAARPEVPYHQGQITRGMNRLYRQAGKITRAMDDDIGTAMIEAARNTADEGEPDDSVGAAWDELARVNPRVRRFCVMLVSGGVYGQLLMAHAPIALAIMMKPAIAERIPFARFLASMAEPDEDTPAGEGGLPGGMTADDVVQMAAMADQFASRIGMSVPPEVVDQMQAAAADTSNGTSPPQMRAAPARSQQRRQRRRPG
jgi:hypothetical protein